MPTNGEVTNTTFGSEASVARGDDGVGGGTAEGGATAEGGESGSSNEEPPAIGTAPLGGAGGGFFIGDYK